MVYGLVTILLTPIIIGTSRADIQNKTTGLLPLKNGSSLQIIESM